MLGHLGLVTDAFLLGALFPPPGPLHVLHRTPLPTGAVPVEGPSPAGPPFPAPAAKALPPLAHLRGHHLSCAKAESESGNRRLYALTWRCKEQKEPFLGAALMLRLNGYGPLASVQLTL